MPHPLTRTSALIAAALALVSLLLPLCSQYLHPYRMPLEYLGQDVFNPLWRADLVSRGEVIYRDFACQYGPSGVYLYAAVAQGAGNSIQSLLLYNIVLGAIAIVPMYLLLNRVAGPWPAALTSIWFGFLFNGLCLHAEYVPLERLLFFSLMLSWRSPLERPVWGSLLLGCMFGFWQTLKFGGGIFACVSLACTDLLAIAWTQRSRAGLKVYIRQMIAVTSGLVLVEGILILVAFGLFPKAIAIDTIWPFYAAGDYTLIGLPTTLQGWWSFFLRYWVFWACLAVVIPLTFWEIGSRLRRAPEPTADARQAWGLLFCLLGFGTYLGSYPLMYQYGWVILPALAHGLSLLPRPWQWAFWIICLPAPAYVFKHSLEPARGEAARLRPIELPNGERVYATEQEAESWLKMTLATNELCTSTDRFVVAALGAYGPGGFHFFYDRTFGLRNFMVGTPTFRSYDEAELMEKLPRIPAFILQVKEPSEQVAQSTLKSLFSANVVERLNVDYELSPQLSDGRFAIFVRRKP